LGCCQFIAFDDDALIFVNLKAWMEAEDRRIWVSIRWKSFEVEFAMRVAESFVQGFELFALQWTRRVDITVEEFDDDTLLLDICDPKAAVRQWGHKCRVVREVIEFIEQRVPRDAE